MRWVLRLLAVSLVVGMPAPASAQLFFSTQPHSGFRIGPLIVRASVSPGDGPVRVNVVWSVVAPPGRSPGAAPQDLYLLWPGEVSADGRGEPRDPALARYLEERGFDVIAEGRLPLFAQNIREADGAARAEPVAGGAPYVTFVQYSGALGLSPPATWIRIPWSPKLVDQGWLMDLRMTSPALVKPKAASWLERLVLGQKHLLSLSFNEVRDRPLFPLYFAHRDRVVRLADAPAELVANFPDAGRLKIDEVFPRNTIRRLSETLESTEIVSLFLDTSEGIAPQQVVVQYGYFSRLQAMALVVVPMIFLALGYAVGPVAGRVAAHMGSRMAARVHVGAWNTAPRERESGTVLARETVAKIRPGETTREEVLALCGADVEQYDRLNAPGRRTLVYRGRRIRPQAGRIFGWISTVQHLEVERHEVTIELDNDVVRDVAADVRRSRLPVDEAP